MDATLLKRKTPGLAKLSAGQGKKESSLLPTKKKMKKDKGSAGVLLFKGTQNFRQRLVCSLLSGRPIKIENIRDRDERPGMRPFEANVLRLLDSLTNGTKISINVTGTTLYFHPGMIIGGKLTHDCGTERSVGYYLEMLVSLALYAKNPFTIKLLGITNDNRDMSVDAIRSALLPGLVRTFSLGKTLNLKINKRGAPPEGGGEVIFTAPVVKSIAPILHIDEGKIRRMRGLAYSTRVSPQTANRMVDSARGLLNHWIPDVYIYTDHYKGDESGKSPGFGLSLVTESTTGILLCAEQAASTGGAALPEELGRHAAELMCEEVANGGCVDTSFQSIYLLFMALSEENVSKIRLGKLSRYTIQFLRHLKDFFSVVFKIKPDHENGTVLLSCLGAGVKNFSRKAN